MRSHSTVIFKYSTTPIWKTGGFIFLLRHSRSWIEFYQLVGDPFDTLPLQSEDDLRSLFVRTEDIGEHVDPLIDYFLESRPFIRTVIGARGSGKSTLLHYIAWKIRQLQQSIVAYVPHQPSVLEGQRDLLYGVGLDTLNKVLIELARALQRKFQTDLPQELHDILKKLGLVESETVTMPEWSYNSAERHLERILAIVAQLKLHGLVAIDNYDKINEKVALDFLSSHYAQPFFERLQASGVSVILTADQSWGDAMVADSDLSYLGRPISLKPLNLSEAKSILQARIKAKRPAESDRSLPFTDEALDRITISKNGIARDILETCRSCLIDSAKRGIVQIDENTVNDFLRNEQLVGERYYELIRSSDSTEKGYKFLVSLKSEFDADSYRSFLVALVDLFEKRGIPAEMQEILREKRVVALAPSLTDPMRRELHIDQMVKGLLEAIASRFSLKRFIDWLARTTEIAVLVVPTAKQQESREEVENRFQQLLDLSPPERTRDIREYVRNAQVSFKSVVQDLDNRDYNITQTFSSMWACCNSLANAAFLASGSSKRLTEQSLPDFLIRNPTIRDVYLDVEIIRAHYYASERGAPVPATLLEELYPRFERVTVKLIELAHDYLSKLREVIRQPIMYVIRDGTQLEEKIRPYIRSPEAYLCVRLGDKTLYEFTMLCWQFKNYVYAITLGDVKTLDQMGLDVYTLKTPHPFVKPSYIENQIQVDGLRANRMLRYFNISEFSRSIQSLAIRRGTSLIAMSKAMTVQMDIHPTEDSELEASIQFLGRCYGESLAVLEKTKDARSKEQEMTDAYAKLREIEINLSAAIQSIISKRSPRWWDECIPSDIKEDARKRKLGRERVWPHVGEFDPEFRYLTFGDYVKIIEKKDNWPAFEKVFGDKEYTISRLKQLEVIRNVVMHPQPGRILSNSQLEKLKLFAEEILASLREARL